MPHGHLDLLSYHVVVEGERLIASIGPRSYHDTTFSPRRYELPETNPQTKNTLFVNGVGVAVDSTLGSTRRLAGDGFIGLRLESTEAMGVTRGNDPTATFCGRLALLLEGRALVIIDRVELPFVGLIESRLHSYAEVTASAAGGSIRGERAILQVACAADVACQTGTARPALTEIVAPQPTALRWATVAQVRTASLVTLLAPGTEPATATVAADGRHRLAVTVRQGDWSRRLILTRRLNVVPS